MKTTYRGSKQLRRDVKQLQRHEIKDMTDNEKQETKRCSTTDTQNNFKGMKNWHRDTK